MTDPFAIETGLGVEVSVTTKGGPGYDAPWVVYKGDIDAVARKMGFTEEREAKASDLNKLVPAVAKHFQQQYEGGSPKGR